MAGGDSVEASPATAFLPSAALQQATPVLQEAAVSTGGKVDSCINTPDDIRMRPHEYVGSLNEQTEKLWVYEDNMMVYRDVTYTPGLLKLFDGVLITATNSACMNEIRVLFDTDRGGISVFYNGSDIAVNKCKGRKGDMYIPEAIFGNYPTDSKYKDIVLANILSSACIIGTCDGNRKYSQLFSQNMVKRRDADISDSDSTVKWTKIAFKPDLAKFNMSKFDNDIVGLMRKRVVDFAGLLNNTTVKLDGKKLYVNNFLNYVKLYLHSPSKVLPQAPPPRILHELINDKWEVCVCLREGQREGQHFQFQHMSFVNLFATTKGGSHIDHVADKIATHVTNITNHTSKDDVKRYLWIFLKSSIDNPIFESKTQDKLISPISSFESTCELSLNFWKEVENWSKAVFQKPIESDGLEKVQKPIETGGLKKRRVCIQKLEDALCAGTKESHKCTLILTEGDSAKTLAMGGLSEIGREYFGIYPLKGKVPNVRDGNSEATENVELKNVMTILGLQHGKVYNSTEGLRYGYLMMMTDQDDDGAHIKGLLINFIHYYWPSLLKLKSDNHTFLSDFITPIIKATNREDRSVESFYSTPAFDKWKESIGEDLSHLWSIKHYKGLGTSTVEEGSHYFKDINKNRRDYIWLDDEDDEAITLAFDKKRSDVRKVWLNRFEPGIDIDASENDIRIRDFFSNEFFLFSMANLHRSIPSMADGCKPGQRKVLYSSLKKDLVKETKVCDFAGYVSENTSYRHGDQSLANTIIGMAQTFVGSNNINLLHPGGQFGTRLKGGKDSASSRYIYTKLSPIARSIFHEDDDPLLDYKNEDGYLIEPTWYIPVVPMVLINGAEGIGTGWKTYVPNFNPRDIVYNLRKLIIGDRETIQPLLPWFRHFTGTVGDYATGHIFFGRIQRINKTVLHITELPIRMWIDNYKEFLDTLVPNFVKEYTVNVDTNHVDILVTLGEENMKKAIEENILKKFNLMNSVSTSNMNLFDADGVLKNYSSSNEILDEFFSLRLKYYHKRMEMLLERLKREQKIFDNRVRFLEEVVSEEIKIDKMNVSEIIQQLKEKSFDAFEKGPAAGAQEYPENEAGGSSVANLSGYDYLLYMPIINLAVDKRSDLVNEKEKVENHFHQLNQETPQSLWLRDLDYFEKHLDVLDQEDSVAVRRRDMRNLKKLKDKQQVRSGSSDNLTARPSKVPLMVICTDGDNVDNDGRLARATNTGGDSVDNEAISIPVKKARVLSHHL